MLTWNHPRRRSASCVTAKSHSWCQHRRGQQGHPCERYVLDEIAAHRAGSGGFSETWLPPHAPQVQSSFGPEGIMRTLGKLSTKVIQVGDEAVDDAVFIRMSTPAETAAWRTSPEVRAAILWTAPPSACPDPCPGPAVARCATLVVRTQQRGTGGAMPIEVSLSVEYSERDAWRELRHCPTIDAALGRAADAERVDVTALVLEESVSGGTYPLAFADAVFVTTLVDTGRRVLLPGDVADRNGGRRHAWFVGRVRVVFLAWLARVARRARGVLRVTYLHERGDYPYEFAQWSFGRREDLVLADYDGRDRPRWLARAARWRRQRDPAPRPLVHRPFAQLLRAAPR
jgi:hypothetical protein